LAANSAPVAQGIEHRPPEAGAQVQFLPGAHLYSKCDVNLKIFIFHLKISLFIN
jgi:hypothetical protein